MHPVNHTSTTAQPTTPDSRELTRALGAAFAAIALAGMILGAIVFLTARPAPTSDAAPTTTGEVRDGWSSYLGAAARPASQPVQDGWSSYCWSPRSIRPPWSMAGARTCWLPRSIRPPWSTAG